jgi:hypothetical protein
MISRVDSGRYVRQTNQDFFLVVCHQSLRFECSRVPVLNLRRDSERIRTPGDRKALVRELQVLLHAVRISR